jgi:lipopolysaccharide transport system permease protein
MTTQIKQEPLLAHPAPTLTLIEPSRGWRSLDLKSLWEYRELVFYMAVREIQGVYRQTALGFSWILIRPIINMLLLSVVFGGLVKVPSDDYPYPLFSLAALIPWGYFSNAVIKSSRSLVDNLHIISKVYFPRFILPIAATVTGWIDLVVSFLVFLIAMLIYQMPLRIEMLWLPLLVVMCTAFSLSFGLWMATLSVRYRDVSFAIGFILQAMMYASPVIYSVSLIPSALRPFYLLNPMTGVIQGFRWALLGGPAPITELVIAVFVIIILLVSGMFVFNRTERSIVDVL